MGKVLLTYPVVNDNTEMDSLSFTDKILATVFQWFRDSGREELHHNLLSNIVMEDVLALQADLISFLNKALIPLRKGKKRKVIVEIDSIFVIILKETLKNKRYQDFYDIKILKWPKGDYNIKYTVTIEMSAR